LAEQLLCARHHSGSWREQRSFIFCGGGGWGWVGKPQDEVKWMMVEHEEREEQEVDLTLN